MPSLLSSFYISCIIVFSLYLALLYQTYKYISHFYKPSINDMEDEQLLNCIYDFGKID